MAGSIIILISKKGKGKKEMNRKVCSILITVTLLCMALTGCSTEASQVAYNISKEADNFNVTRKLTVINARTDTVLLEMIGTFSLKNNTASEMEIICEVSEGVYQKHFVYLNEYTLYVVEDISGAEVDKYHYEINFLPEWGFKITHSE